MKTGTHVMQRLRLRLLLLRLLLLRLLLLRLLLLWRRRRRRPKMPSMVCVDQHQHTTWTPGWPAPARPLQFPTLCPALLRKVCTRTRSYILSH